MNDTRAFYPLYKPFSSANATAGTLENSVTVAGTASAVASAVFPGSGDQNNYVAIQIANTSTAWAYVNFGKLYGGQTVTAATVAASYPVAPGAVVVLSVHPEVNAASVILSTGTGNVIFTRGDGL